MNSLRQKLVDDFVDSPWTIMAHESYETNAYSWANTVTNVIDWYMANDKPQEWVNDTTYE